MLQTIKQTTSTAQHGEVELESRVSSGTAIDDLADLRKPTQDGIWLAFVWEAVRKFQGYRLDLESVSKQASK